jgi:hypothetical protein
MWIMLSVATMGLMAAMLLLLSGVNRLGVDQPITLLCLFFLILVVNYAYLLVVGTPLRLPKTALPWVLMACAALASFLGNLCCLKAMAVAPNPGYPIAIEGAKVVIVTLVSVWLFAAHFSILKGLGVLCCAIGVALMCL